LFNNARYNGILILDTQGIIQKINHAFHIRFGYTAAELDGKNFSVLFTEKDREKNKPEMEIQKAITEGSANDENYLVHKDGNKIWVTGESVFIDNNNENYIVKVVHNIHAQKQLERFLMQSHEFIDTVFDSIKESALMILDSRIRIVKVNAAFLELFELKQPPAEGSRLVELDHPFWQRTDVKQEAINFLVTHNAGKEKIFEMETKAGLSKKLSFKAKLVDGIPEAERKLLIMIKVIN
jgi:PAS domain S-box-containing protein